MMPYSGTFLGDLLHPERLTYDLAWKVKVGQEPHIANVHYVA